MRALGAFAAPCSGLNSRFYLLGTALRRDCTGTAAPLVPWLLEGGLACAGDAAGICRAMDAGQERRRARRR